MKTEIQTAIPTAPAPACGAGNCDGCPINNEDDCVGYMEFLETEGKRLAPEDYICNGVY